MIRRLSFVVVFRILVVCHLALSAYGHRKNVLFIMSDDLRPEIATYDAKHMVTPNLDKLASQSALFEHAYVQQAICAPSRTSMLTGRRPDTTRVIDLLHYWRDVAGNFTTLPEYFKQHGYKTAGLGKVFHPGLASDYNDPPSWTEPYFMPHFYWEHYDHISWLAINESLIKEHPLTDMQSADAAVKQLEKFAKSETPFFLAVGFYKPHLPFQFPKKFLDLYPEESVKLPSNPYAPVNMPEIAWSNYYFLRHYVDIHRLHSFGCINTTLPDDVVLSLRRAYYATVSYVDSLVGQVLDSLDKLNLASNTIVSFVGDHGWQLGEHGEWSKLTNFEVATRAPMMLKIPGLTDAGLRSKDLVEFVDIFPTIADAAGLPVPKLCPSDSLKISLCAEGISLMPLISTNVTRAWKSAAFSQFPRMPNSGGMYMGYTMRTVAYRYTEWVKYDIFTFRPLELLDHPHESMVELYDHRVDPDENHNVADEQRYSEIRKKLAQQLANGWRHALPQ